MTLTPDERHLLQKTLELAEENNAILRKLRRSQFWGNVLRIFYWVIIALISFGAYYFLQPYIDQASKAYKSIQNDLQEVSNVKDAIFGKLPSIKK